VNSLTADLYARAIIAAAASYGDDPVAACEARRGPVRRSLAPAVVALSRVLQKPRREVARALGIDAGNLARAEFTPGFEAAFERAEAAVRQATSPPVVTVHPPALEPHPEPEPPAARAPLPPHAGKRRVLSAGRVRAEVLTVLGEDPSTVPELAQLVGVSEAAVRQVLSTLAEQGTVRGDALTTEGWRAQFWRLTGEEA
jgi:hypothetical protein